MDNEIKSDKLHYLKVNTYAGFDIYIFLEKGTLLGLFFVCPEGNHFNYLSKNGIHSSMQGDDSWCESYKAAVKLINSHLVRKISR